ncbi:MAG: zf-HC2 domain-containing protein [Gammaproteobacteria bacterium]|nr:zf-HC2 domain-containing protein [Gammaproteobacteria bacterium]MDE2250375.1 zf-HC2 domain-containing protein [Gammaproteobacteria bacterium]
MNHAEARALLEAYLDEQLEIGDTVRVAAHLAECESCRAWLGERRALRAQLRTAPLRYRMPAALAAEIRSQAVPARGAPLRQRLLEMQWPRALAASVLVGLAGLWAGHALTVRRIAGEEWVGAYVRSNLGARSLDVLSSDHHTVKPWLSARLTYSPPVPEMSGPDDELLGARVDYIERSAVAALVYRHGKHQVDVFVWPERERPDPATAANAAPIAGFRLLSSRAAGFNVVIVSDMSASEMIGFRARWSGLASAR